MEVELDVQAYEAGLEFFPVSHVWSGGLGNPQGNALPWCQLKTLALTAQQIQIAGGVLLSRETADVLIWVDTLCVPIQASMRETAIHRKQPYM